MTTMFRVCLTLLFACCTFRTFAQGYTEILQFNVDYLPLHTAGEKSDGTRLALNALLPVAVDREKDAWLLAGLSAESIHFSGATVPGAARFFGLTPVVGYSGKISGKCKLSVLLMPFLNSDLKRDEGGQMHFAGMARWAVKESETFTWRITTGYRQQFFGPQYVLLAGMDWKAGERLQLFGDLPQNFTVAYQTGKKLDLGLTYLANLLSYNISGEGRYMRYNYANASLFAELFLTGNLVLRGEAGYAFTRKFEVYDDKDKPDATLIFFRIGNKPVPLNDPYDKGAIFRLLMAYRVY